jgi:hypothetical protein
MTTPEFTNEAFAALGAPNLVYVRPVKARELIGATPVDTVEGFSIDPEQTLYAVHGADGARLAVLGDYDAAIAAAIANDLAPVAVN